MGWIDIMFLVIMAVGVAYGAWTGFVMQMANLVGYDPDQAAGIFTQGGTFCNLYGYLMGIRKSMPIHPS